MTPKPRWIFLRGLTRASGHWGAFLPQFARAMPGCEVVPLDLPGNGSLCRHTSPTRVQDMVAHCRAELHRRRLPPPYHLFGMSLGAMVAVAWSAAYPDEVAAQVLVNTSLRPVSPFYQRLRPRNYGVLLRLALRVASPQDWERNILRITSNRAHDQVLPLWQALREQHPVSRTNALRQLLAAARFRAPKTLTTPTLLLASAQDQLVLVACSQALARQWQCGLQIHPTAGHDLPLDEGNWVVQQVFGWVQ